jgi:hypothetical protein
MSPTAEARVLAVRCKLERQNSVMPHAALSWQLHPLLVMRQVAYSNRFSFSLVTRRCKRPNGISDAGRTSERLSMMDFESHHQTGCLRSLGLSRDNPVYRQRPLEPQSVVFQEETGRIHSQPLKTTKPPSGGHRLTALPLVPWGQNKTHLNSTTFLHNKQDQSANTLGTTTHRR